MRKLAPLAAAAALGTALALAAGCGETKTVTETTNSTIVQSVTDTVARTTVTQDVTTTAPAPEPKATDTFEGNGSRRLPPLEVKQDSTLKWTNDDTLFQLHNTDFNGPVDISSEAQSGESFVPAGSYELEVGAAGNWTITIQPNQ